MNIHQRTVRHAMELSAEDLGPISHRFSAANRGPVKVGKRKRTEQIGPELNGFCTHPGLRRVMLSRLKPRRTCEPIEQNSEDDIIVKLAFLTG